MSSTILFSSPRYALGLFFVFLVAVIWAGASVLVQYLYNDLSFDSPFLLTYIGTSLFTILLPLDYITTKIRQQIRTSQEQQREQQEQQRRRRQQQPQVRQQEVNSLFIASSGTGAGFGTDVSTPSPNLGDYSSIASPSNEPDSTRADASTLNPYSDNNTTSIIPDGQQRQELHQPLHTSSLPTSHQRQDDHHTTVDHQYQQQHFQAEQGQRQSQEEEEEQQQQHSNGMNRHWTRKDHMWAAAKIAPVWFISNHAYNASLKYTSITSSTVLASTGSLFTFLFALMLRDEHFSLWKLVGVIMGMTGSILTALHDVSNMNNDNPANSYNSSTSLGFIDNEFSTIPDDPSAYFVENMMGLDGNDDNGNNTSTNDDATDMNFANGLWGDTLGLISAVGYGAYAVMVRILCPKDESLMSMQTFLGFVGLWNMLALSPIAFYQLVIVPNNSNNNNNNAGTSSSDPSAASSLTWFVFGCLVIKGLIDNVLSDYLWARAVVLTSATVATVGLGLTIPLAFASDVILGHPNVLDTSSIFGALAVLIGFVLVNVGQQKEEEIEYNGNNEYNVNDDIDNDIYEQRAGFDQTFHTTPEITIVDQLQQQQQHQSQQPSNTQNQYHHGDVRDGPLLRPMSMEYKDATTNDGTTCTTTTTTTRTITEKFDNKIL